MLEIHLYNTATGHDEIVEFIPDDPFSDVAQYPGQPWGRHYAECRAASMQARAETDHTFRVEQH